MSVFYDRLSLLCAENGIEMSKLGKEIGMPKLAGSTISRWSDGVIPRNVTVKAIADYFKVDVAYLLGKESVKRNEEAVPAERDCQSCPCKDRCDRCLSPQERQIIDMFRSASEIGKLRILRQLLDVWEQDQQE